MHLSSVKLGLFFLLCQLLVNVYVNGETNMKEASPPSTNKRSRSKADLERKDALIKALERGIFARRSVSSQPPGVWGRSIESHMRSRENNQDRFILRPQSPAERRSLRNSIHHLLQAKEALDDLSKRISQPPGVWGKRMVSQPPGVWGKRNIRTQPPGVWGKRSVRTQPPGVWGKRSSDFIEREYILNDEDANEDDSILARSASISQPPGVWGRRSIELSHTDEQ